jgi:F-type H+-transporting ATPase subunit a
VIASLAELPAADIKVGDHPTGHFLGLAFNIDTVYTTAIAGVVTVIFMLFVARSVSSAVPNKLQVLV